MSREVYGETYVIHNTRICRSRGVHINSISKKFKKGKTDNYTNWSKTYKCGHYGEREVLIFDKITYIFPIAFN